MRVMALPARRNRDRNPYNFLLSEALAENGWQVVEFNRRQAVLERFDVVHIHWPQQEVRGRPLQAFQKALLLAGLLWLQRLKGARIVWTVHNARGHDQDNVRLERALVGAVTQLVHGVIFPSPSSRQAAYREMPRLASKPFEITLLGLFNQSSATSRASARATFELPPDKPVVGFLGDIRAYKGLDLLIDAFAATAPSSAVLFIAGAFHDDTPYRTETKARLSRLTEHGHSVVFREERLGDEALLDAIRACDVVALPYREAWNSALALLVLENRTPILTTDAPVFRELRDEVGPGWVHIAEGGLTAEALMNALSSPRTLPADARPAFAPDRSWSAIGAQTAAFYERLRKSRDR